MEQSGKTKSRNGFCRKNNQRKLMIAPDQQEVQAEIARQLKCGQGGLKKKNQALHDLQQIHNGGNVSWTPYFSLHPFDIGLSFTDPPDPIDILIQ